MKISFIIPWYGKDATGGAENLCKGVVEHLIRTDDSIVEDVDVITTCSKSSIGNWQNDFSEGNYEVNDVTVKRFSIDCRETKLFDSIGYRLLKDLPVGIKAERLFMQNNINSEKMYNYLRKIKEDEHDRLFVFIPYLYGTTFYGSQVCGGRSVIIPCLHDEPYARMGLMKSMFDNMTGIIFNSVAEMNLAESLYGSLSKAKKAVIGHGFDVTDPNKMQYNPSRFKNKYHLDKFILYVGRKSQQKNVPLLIQYFLDYITNDNNGNGLKLVLAGPNSYDLATKYKKNIIDLISIPKQELYDAYSAATATCQPSTNESFSIAIMESWLCGRPVLVNANCPATKEFSIQSNGGLYFNNYAEFREILDTLLLNPHIANALGQNGRKFVIDNFNWETVTSRYIEFFKSMLPTVK